MISQFIVKLVTQVLERTELLFMESVRFHSARDLPGSPENDADFISMLAGLMVDKKPEAVPFTSPAQNGGIETPESPTRAQHRWETYLQSRARASRNMVRKSRPLSLGSAFPPTTHAQENLRAHSFCLEDKRAVQKALDERVSVPSQAPPDNSDVDGPEPENKGR